MRFWAKNISQSTRLEGGIIGAIKEAVVQQCGGCLVEKTWPDMH